MRWTVVVPGALLPAPIAADVIGAAAAPHLARLVARARIGAPQSAATATAGAAHWGWLWRRFAGRDDVPVTAPYAWRALNESDLQADADDSLLWQADPVHFAVARDHVLAVPLDDADALDHAETIALASEAEACARTMDVRLRVLDRHWFIRFDRPWSLVATPLDAALGESIQPLLPTGPDSARWRRLLTEIQIAWHHHPVNAAREARGARAVNGLWLHGGGAYTTFPACGLTQVASDEPAVRGWALAAGVPAAAVAAEATAITARGDALILWPRLLTSSRAEAWHAWLAGLAALDAWLDRFARHAFASGAEVELVLCGSRQTRTMVIGAGDRWRIWRNIPLVDVMTESPVR